MKKMLGFIVAVMLLCGFAGHAMASFTDDQELIRVVFDTTFNPSTHQPMAGSGTNEVFTDLGNLSTLIPSLSGGPLTVGGGANAFNNFAGFGSTVSYSNLLVTYFAIDTGSVTGNFNAWVSGSKQISSADSGFGGFTGVTNPLSLAGVHPYQVNPSTMVIPQSNVNSFNQGPEQTGPGTYGNFINTANAFDTESKLTNLASGGTVTQTLYGGLDVNGTDVGTATNGLAVLDITTNANGSTTLQAVPVPDPPSALLLLSSLVGAIGFYRKAS